MLRSFILVTCKYTSCTTVWFNNISFSMCNWCIGPNINFKYTTVYELQSAILTRWTLYDHEARLVKIEIKVNLIHSI